MNEHKTTELEALAERWERTADSLYDGYNQTNFLGDKWTANTWKQAAKELRACLESASQ